MTTAGFGSLPFGSGPFGSEFTHFRVEAATALSPTLVKIDFSEPLDPEHAPNFNPAYYVIAGLAVTNVDVFGPRSVILQTALQAATTTYDLVVSATVGVLRALSGAPLDPTASSASFNGGTDTATFNAVAQSSVKLRLNFSAAMQIDAAFLDPQNYEIADVNGLPVAVAVESITTLGDDLTRAEVLLHDQLTPFALYSLSVSTAVRTILDKPLFPDQALVRWKRVIPSPIRLRTRDFSGEVSGGLLGSPAGQVFISPAYGAGSPNSVLEIQSVAVCTRAFDVYTVPGIPDPVALFTFPARAGSSALIGLGGGVLTASAHRLGQAILNLADRREDEVEAPEDGPAEGLLTEPIDITRASFLNDGRWRTFPGVGASLGAFTTADNATPIGPGPTIGPFSIT